MDANELAACLDIIAHGEIAAAMAYDARKRLLEHFAEGGKVDGYKPARALGRERVWKSESHARKVLTDKGFAEDVIVEKPKLRSVAELERLIGRETVAGLFHYPPRGVVIVEETSQLERVEYAPR